MKNKIKVVIILLLFLIGIIVAIKWKIGEPVRFVTEMGVGINLGNSLDATNVKEYKEDADVAYYETAWSNPPITQKMFAAIYEAGFKTVRIPVSWEEHLDQEGTIDSAWLERVHEVVLQAIAENLYVVLDVHHESWVIPTLEKEKETTRLLCKVWQQIAKKFSKVGEHLLFESMNEPRLVNSELEWNGGSAEMRQVVNRLNMAFVETVRTAGGENKTRYLLLPAYGSSGMVDALEALELPPNDKHIIVSVHAYCSYDFSQKEEGTRHWSREEIKDTEEITELTTFLQKRFIRKGIPVIISEFACMDKNNLQDRLAWTTFYTEAARTNKLGYIWWDDGKKFAIFNRHDSTWIYPEIKNVLTLKGKR
ncbi:MAG: glycoside hydrolase family 5 protein [Lachnospiraceae bacterium]